MSDMKSKANQAVGQAQATKDGMAAKASQTAQSCKESCQEGKDQAGGMMQQAGDRVKNMAQGAADTVKNAAGMAQDKTKQ